MANYTNPLRHVQFFRNGEIATDLQTAISAINGQRHQLNDGEIIIGRYKVGTGENETIHAVLGVAHKNGTTVTLDYFYCHDEQVNAINALDNAGETMASIDGGIVTIYKTITETDGVIDINESDDNKITFAKVATTGAASDVSYNDTNSSLSTDNNTVNNVQTAIEALDTRIDSLSSDALLHLYKGTETVEDVKADGTEYVLRQGGTSSETGTLVAKFNIEKDSFVKTGDVVRGSLNDSVFTRDDNGEYFIHLVINTHDAETDATAEKDVYIPAESLVDAYVGDNTYIEVDKDTNTIKHKNSSVTDGTYGEQTSGDTLSYGSDLIIPKFTVDAAGHITNASNTKMKLPSKQDASDALSIAVESNKATITDTFTLDETTTSSAVTVEVADGLNMAAVATDGTTSGIKISHSSAYVVGANGDAVTVAEAGNTTTFSVPTLEIDAWGHVKSKSDTEYTIALPSAISTAVQTVTSVEALSADKFVAVHANRTDNDVVLTSELKTTDAVYTKATSEAPDANLAVPISTTGLLTHASVKAIKDYVDAKAAKSNTVVTSTATDGIKVTSATDATTQATTYDVTLELADKATTAYTDTLHEEAVNLLKIASDGKLSISDTWDCGTF